MSAKSGEDLPSKEAVVVGGGHKPPRFKDMTSAVEYFQGRMEDVTKATLRICWELGGTVNAIKDRAAYGTATVKDFAERLGNPGVDEKVLWRYGQFASAYSEKELEETLGRRHIGWGVINKILSIKDKGERLQIEMKLDSGELKPSKLEEALREYRDKQEGGGEPPQPSAKPGKGGGEKRNFTCNFLKLATLCGGMGNALKACLKDLDDLDLALEGGKEGYDLVLEAVASASSEASKLASALSDFSEEAEKRQ